MKIPLARWKADALKQPNICGLYFVPAHCVAAGKRFRKNWHCTGGGLTYIAKDSNAAVCHSTRVFSRNKTSSKCIKPGTLQMRCYVLHSDKCGCNRCFRSRSSLPANSQPVRSGVKEELHPEANEFALVQIICKPEQSTDPCCFRTDTQLLVQVLPPCSPFEYPVGATSSFGDECSPLAADDSSGADGEQAETPESTSMASADSAEQSPLCDNGSLFPAAGHHPVQTSPPSSVMDKYPLAAPLNEDHVGPLAADDSVGADGDRLVAPASADSVGQLDWSPKGQSTLPSRFGAELGLALEMTTPNPASSPEEDGDSDASPLWVWYLSTRLFDPPDTHFGRSETPFLGGDSESIHAALAPGDDAAVEIAGETLDHSAEDPGIGPSVVHTATSSPVQAPPAPTFPFPRRKDAFPVAAGRAGPAVTRRRWRDLPALRAGAPAARDPPRQRPAGGAVTVTYEAGGGRPDRPVERASAGVQAPVSSPPRPPPA